MKPQLSRSTLAAIALTLFGWASAFAGIRASLDAYTPGQIAFLRCFIASIILSCYLLFTRKSLPKKRDLPAIAAMGFLGMTGYYLLLNYGSKTITAGSASLLTNMTPIFTALLANLFLGERLSLRRWFGIFVSFTGVVFIASGEARGLNFNLGAILVLFSALSLSIYTIVQKSHIRHYSPLQLTTYISWAGTILLMPFLTSTLNTLANAPLSATGAVIYLGILSTAVAYGCWAYVLSQIPASRAASFLYLIPLLATFIAWIWLGEIPTFLSLIGGAIILCGVAIVNSGRHSTPSSE